MLANRTTAILFVGTLSLLFIFKRHLEELKGVSYLFITVVFLFVTLLFVELMRDDGKLREPFPELAAIKVDYHLLTAISIFIFAYSYQFMVFPAYSELEQRSNARFAQVSLLSLLMYTFALISTGVISVLLFGKSLKADLLDNVAVRTGVVSIFIRTVYCFILVFHLPYIFFSVKEYSLVMYDEYFNKMLSSHL